VLTPSTGRFTLTRARHAGSYYATSPRALIADRGDCNATTSPKLRLR
jgi:hypothetical protein